MPTSQSTWELLRVYTAAAYYYYLYCILFRDETENTCTKDKPCGNNGLPYISEINICVHSFCNIYPVCSG